MSYKRFLVTAVRGVTLHTGKIRASADQYQSRKHQLEPIGKKGEYAILQPVTFKRGETIEFDGDIPKQHADDLDIVVREKAAAEAKAKAEADKAALREKMLADLNAEIADCNDTIAELLARQEAAETPEAKAEFDESLAKTREQLVRAQEDLAQLGG